MAVVLLLLVENWSCLLRCDTLIRFVRRNQGAWSAPSAATYRISVAWSLICISPRWGSGTQAHALKDTTHSMTSTEGLPVAPKRAAKSNAWRLQTPRISG